ncbi:MAG TPA: M3 family metallopeptidase [Puia sp.]|nr:M3 family metallopeptidase [Puia sp.]
MIKLKQLFTVSFLLVLQTAFSQSGSAQNPLLLHSNDPIRFDRIDAPVIRQAVASVITLSDNRIKHIQGMNVSGNDATGILHAYDELLYDINDVAIKLGLISQTYTSDSARDAANDGSQALSDYTTRLYLNEPLYKKLKAYETAMQSKFAPNQKKFINEQVRIFENNGMKLDPNGRKELQEISDKITVLGLAFDKNIATSRDSIIYSEADLKGVPDNVKQAWKRPSGEYLLYINTPNTQNILRYAGADNTRQLIYFKYNNRAYPSNIKVLDSLLYYRQRYAEKLGYRSYAEYALVDKMAHTPEAVWGFENNLISKLAPKVTSDLNELREIKHQMHPDLPDTIFAWDIGYYKRILLDTKYKLNTDELKPYFEMNNTIAGMFEVYHRLLGVTVKEVHGVPVWYSKVKSFEMYKDGKKIGSFYFDLYPRRDKYTHFACFPISQSRQLPGKEILPVAALICNFPEAAAGQPTLVDHNDVITLFHEFGHLVAAMLVRSNIASQPFTLKPDFVEAPSQFLENFCWEYPSLKIFAKHYQTGAVLPESLFEKLKSTEHVLDGQYYMQQLYYGVIDFTFHDKYDSIKSLDINQVSDDLHAMVQYPFVEGTHFIASFNHLNGYAANYYGYLWSRVFAEDIFSVFKKNGVMDPNTGLRYRKDILEVLGSQEEMDMLRHFLGREPNSDAFMKSIGL